MPSLFSDLRSPFTFRDRNMLDSSARKRRSAQGAARSLVDAYGQEQRFAKILTPLSPRTLGALFSHRSDIGSRPAAPCPRPSQIEHHVKSAGASNHRRLVDGRFCFEFNRCMAAIAERLVLRCATSTNGHTVADFVVITVCRSERDAPSQPNRPAAIFHWVFNQTD